MKKQLIGLGILYEGDTLKVMDYLINEGVTVDAIITDPPYNIGYDNWDLIDFKEIKKRLDKLLKPSGNLILFTGFSTSPELIRIFNDYFLNNWIIWDRIKGRGTTKNLISTREDILWFSKDKNYYYDKSSAISNIKKITRGYGDKNGCEFRKLSNVWSDISPLVPWSKERNGHPTQKPLQLMNRIIKLFTKEKDLILDFTSGSGSTLESCENLERRWIGIEISSKYNKISCERLNHKYEPTKIKKK